MILRVSTTQLFLYIQKKEVQMQVLEGKVKYSEFFDSDV